jgi:hypothetical protein
MVVAITEFFSDLNTDLRIKVLLNNDGSPDKEFILLTCGGKDYSDNMDYILKSYRDLRSNFKTEHSLDLKNFLLSCGIIEDNFEEIYKVFQSCFAYLLEEPYICTEDDVLIYGNHASDENNL